jgi:hypothetical protein
MADGPTPYRKVGPLRTVRLTRKLGLPRLLLAWAFLGLVIGAALLFLRPEPAMSALAALLGGFAIAALVLAPSLRARGGWRGAAGTLRIYRDRVELERNDVLTVVPMGRLRVELSSPEAEQMAKQPPRLLRVVGGEQPVDLPFSAFASDDEAEELANELESLRQVQRDR